MRIDCNHFDGYLWKVVPQARIIISRIPLLVVTLVATAGWLHAEDAPAKTDADGYRIVPVTVGGHTMPVRVEERMKDPFRNVKDTTPAGKYDPERLFSSGSSYANKSFSMQSDASTQKSSGLKEQDREKFVTKAYDGPGSSKNEANAKVDATEASTFNKSATGLNKNFSTTAAADYSHTTVLDKTKPADEQSRTADSNSPEKSPLLAENSMSNKQYLGPGAQHVPTNVDVKENVVLSRVNDIPHRAMTIDEVRNLINHESKPNTEDKADPSSKALNDPDFKPEPMRASPDTDSAPAPRAHRALDDDSDSSVPSPGMMSNPPAADDEKLPQRS